MGPLGEILTDLINYAVPEERREELKKKVAAAVADTDDEGISELNAPEAKEAIENCDDIEQLQNWRAAEEGNKDRTSVKAAIDNRIEELEEAAENDNR